MTNREVYEEAAGMGLDGSFFAFNKIDPNEECIKPASQNIIKAENSRQQSSQGQGL